MPSDISMPGLLPPPASKIQSLFNAIPKSYDCLNTVMSFGQDAWWRKTIARRAQRRLARNASRQKAGHSLLDLGTGTGKSLAAFIQTGCFEKAVGCDFALEMLSCAKARFDSFAPLAQQRIPLLLACDFHSLPFRKEIFDVVTGSFILRSVQNLDSFFQEISRVLKQKGLALFLVLTRPKQAFFWNLIYRPYLRYYIPTVGRFFSRHEGAYEFLSSSIQSFAEPAVVCEHMRRHGIGNIQMKSMSWGAVTIIEGEKQ